MSFFTRAQTGALTSRMNNDVLGAQRAVTGTLGSVVSNVVTLVANGAAIIFLDWRFAVITLLLLPLFIVPTKRVGRRLQDLTRQQMDLNASMNTTMTERFNVSGALLVKLFGRPTEETADFAARADRVRAVGVRSAVYSRTFFVALGLVGALAAAAVYWIGGQMAISGTITVGTLVALATFVSRIYGPLTSLTNARVDVMTALVSFERVFEVLDAPNPIPDRPGAVDLVAPRGRVELQDVRFAYPSEPIVASLEAVGPTRRPGGAGASLVLRGVSAVIEPGQLVALVGPSGAGKTTLSQLVPRLYDVTSGAVRVDGTDVRDLTQESLRAAIGIVSQDAHLFHDTIGNNLRYARPGATDAEVAEAVRAARIEELIASLPAGLDTLVGRARLPTLGRREAAARHRPHAPQGPRHRHPRRGHQPPRLRERAARAAGAGARPGRAHQPRHRPPALDDPGRRQHPRARRRPPRAAGHPRRAARQRRPLRRPVPDPRAHGAGAGVAGVALHRIPP